jgi:hypothetical protein
MTRKLIGSDEDSNSLSDRSFDTEKMLHDSTFRSDSNVYDDSSDTDLYGSSINTSSGNRSGDYVSNNATLDVKRVR